MKKELSVRKTSGRYKLVFLEPSTGGQLLISCDVRTGKILPNRSSVARGLDLPVLDIYLLNNFENETMLREHLRNLGYQIPESFIPKIVYKSEGKEKFLELIFQNERLCNLAIICNQYKNKYSAYATGNSMSSRDVRKIISKEIAQEKVWIEFYRQLIESIHIPDFYSFIQEEKLLGERAFGYIKDYLDNEGQHDEEQVLAFESAKYYLKDTFTAYKPIRGMIMCELKYQLVIVPEQERWQQLIKQEKSLIATPTKTVSPIVLNPFDLLTEEQLIYLESHESYQKMTLAQQKDFVAYYFGLIDEPWYLKTNRVLSEIEVAYLEKHETFENLSYFEKIAFANSIIFDEKMSKEVSFQKGKK